MANETFNVTIGANMDVSGILGGVKQIQGAFNGLKLPANVTANMAKDFDKLKESLTKFKALSEKESFSKTDIKNLNKLQGEIDELFNKISSSFNEISGKKIYLEADASKIKEVQTQIDQLKTDIQTKLSGVKIEIGKTDGGKMSLGIEKVVSDMEHGVRSSKVLSAAMKEVQQSMQSGNFSTMGQQLQDIVTKAGTLKGASAGLLETFRQWGIIDFSGPANKIGNMEERTRLLGEAFRKILPSLTEDDEAIKKMAEALGELDSKKAGLEKIAQTNISKTMKEGATAANQLGGAMKETGANAVGMAEATNRAANEVKQLQQSTQYFFSLRNMINLLKRGLREAISTIKELDAAMTKTAVVTEYSVSDMWAKLPEYTANANALGASVKDMYEATTLYYQQGLNAQQAMGIATETMKMARIGGLEAADATDKMTAALRGFNMELNETSAQRVNDVYSNLAAKTASDTEELGTAMQRTASIAASAGMSFEGTAAFLAQAIETTREPAENLGTAMKTIVARFTELKKNPLEITEVDGEEVSYNKVDTALQSIGVSLKDANGQFRDLDKVFLDISQKWNSLTQTQQRYIATTAAGSRQQSRFIAMMSNYQRTLELMDYANNANGASNEQFGKTLESLEAKLNELHNAWSKFLMGIMNEKVTKTVVEGATKALNIITKLIDKLSFNGKLGLVQSLLSITTAFVGLRTAGRGINAVIGGLGGFLDPKSTAKMGFKQGFLGGKVNSISQPIVNAINGLIPHIDGATGAKVGYRYQDPGKYQAARRAQNQMLGAGGTGIGKGNGTYTFGDIFSTFNNNKLNEKQQAAFFSASPGLKHSVASNLGKVLQQAGADSTVTKSLVKGFKDNSIPLEEVFIKAGFGKSLDQAMTEAARSSDPTALTKLTNDYLAPVYKEAIRQGKSQEEAAAEAVQQRKNIQILDTKKLETILGQEFVMTKSEKAAQTIGKIGAGITSLGMGFQMLGAKASAVSPILGQILTTMGSMLTVAGSLANAIPALIANPVVAAIAAIAAAIAVVTVKLHGDMKKAQESAKEVVDSFKEIRDATEENISTLQQYQDQVERWAKGVDKYGNNVNLSSEDYAQYVDAVDKIAEINPDIVEGYNAQGHAIININKALSETIKLEQQRQKEAQEEYLTEASGDKIVKGRDANTDYRKATRAFDEKRIASQWLPGLLGPFVGTITKIVPSLQGSIGKAIDTHLGTNLFTQSTAPFADQVIKIKNKLKKELGDQETQELLGNFGIDWEKLEQNDEVEIRKFVKNRQKIYDAALKANDGEMSTKLSTSFTDLDEQSAAFDESIAATKEWLQTYVSTLSSYKNIPDEFKTFINAGLENIAIQPDLSVDDMQTQSKALIREFDNLTSEGSAYSKAMKEVEQAQNDFASSLDAEEYTQKTGHALAVLNSLMGEYAGKTDAYSQAVKEYLQNQYEQIQKFTEGGAVSLTEALNEVSPTITAAEGAYSAFQEATKSDFATGSENMKSIYDDITKETDGVALHMEERGDNTFWTGARALLGDEFVEANGDNIEAVKKQLKSLEPMLQEGKAGYDAFHQELMKVDPKKAGFDEWLQINEDGSWKIDTTINPDGYKELAQYLNMSEEFLVSMLNKGRQFQGIDFSNVEEVRTALATDEATITNNGKIFAKTDYLNQALTEAGYVNPKDQKRQRKRLAEEGVIEIKDADKITEQDFEQMGIAKGDLQALINAFGETGQFTKEEMAAYAEAFMGDKYRAEDFEGGYQQFLENQEHPEMEPIQSIESTVEQIRNLIDEDRIREGKVTEADKTTAQGFWESVIGKEGENDTEAQHFGEGENKYGSTLTPEEYEANRAKMESAAEEAEKNAALYREAEKNATSEEDKTRAAEIAKLYEQAAQSLRTNLAEGDENWAQKYGQDAYDQRYQEALDAGAPEVEAAKAAEQARIAAENKAKEIIDAITEGAEDGIENGETPDSSSSDTGKGKKGKGKSGTETEDKEESSSSASEPEKKNWLEWINDFAKKGEENRTKNMNDAGPSEESLEKQDSFWKGLESNITSAAKKQKEIEEGYKSIQGPSAEELQQSNKTFWEPGKTTPEQTKGENRTYTNTVEFKAKNAEDVEQKEEDVKKKADKGATHVTEFKTIGDKPVRNEIKKAEQKTTITKPQTQTPTEQESKIKLTVDDKATAQARQIAQKIGRMKASIDVSISQTGSSTVYINVKKKNGGLIGSFTQNVDQGGYTGLSNKIPYVHVPTAGSLAGGTKKGRVGPKNKGGMTLTGELGYEVAWLPDEGRSMILGANGPQMVNLPRNAVVYNHEQSKEIMKKRRGIKAGSLGSSDPYNSSSIPSTTPSPQSQTTVIKKTTDQIKKDSNAIKKKTLETAAKVGKVSVWWENIARTTEGVQRKADKAYSTFEKYIKKMQATLATTGTTGQGDKYITNMTKVLGKNQAQYTKANRELNRLNKSNKKTTIKYKNDKGKDKSKKVKLGNFIKYDSESGSYIIDQKQISRVAKSKKKGGKKAAEAIKAKAEEKINDKQSKRNKAEDEMRKAQEALEKFGQELYENFFEWKTELTQILNITKKIEEAQQRISHIDAYDKLLDAQLGSGQLKAGQNTAKDSLDNFKRRLAEQQEILKKRDEAITESRADLTKALSKGDEQQTLRKVQEKLANNQTYDQAVAAKKQIANATADRKKQKKKRDDLNKKIEALEKKDKNGKLSKKEKEQLSKLKKQRKTVNAAIKKDNAVINNSNLIKQANNVNSYKKYNLNKTQRVGYEAYEEQLKQRIQTIDTANKYMKVTRRADGSVSVDFDTAAFEQAQLNGDIGKDLAKSVEEYVEEIRSSSEDLEKNYESRVQEVTEFYQTLKDLQEQWGNYGKELTNISENAEKKKLEDLKKLSDSVKKALDNLLKEVKNKLDERRKQEDNADKEREISQKQQRLAALRADTAGGHQVEIAQLEKEIADAQQDYQRSLEDQLLDKLQQQADLAAEQRERQIALQEAIASSVNNIALVNTWMANPEQFYDEMLAAYREANDYDKVTNAERIVIDNNFNEMYNGLLKNQDKQSEVQAEIVRLEPKIKDIKDILAKSQYTLEQAQKDGKSIAEARQAGFTDVTNKALKDAGFTWEQFREANISYKDMRSAGFTDKDFAQHKVSYKDAKAAGFTDKELVNNPFYQKEAQASINKSSYDDKIAEVAKDKKLTDKEFKAIKDLAKDAGIGTGRMLQDLANTKNLSWTDVLKAAKSAGYSKYRLALTFNSDAFKKAYNEIYGSDWGNGARSGANTPYNQNYKQAKLKKLTKYAFVTGGIADFTGPAWLDGTPSKPELVLNATDTQNFIALKDVLSRAVNSIGSGDSYGDITYEINISVDKIEKDYDVDRVVDKVKKEIVKSSGYRNVTQVRNLR